MLRMGYMPSDFHPVLLVLGDAQDLQRFAGILAAFARDGTARRLAAENLVHSTDTEVMLASLGDGRKHGLWPDARDSGLLHWTLSGEDAAAFAAEVADLASSGAPAGSVTLECGLLDEVKVKVSVGEWDEHFLEDDAR